MEEVFGSKMGRVSSFSFFYFFLFVCLGFWLVVVFFFLFSYYLVSFPSSCGIALQADFSFSIQPMGLSPRNSLGQTVKEILVFDLATGKQSCEGKLA